MGEVAAGSESEETLGYEDGLPREDICYALAKRILLHPELTDAFLKAWISQETKTPEWEHRRDNVDWPVDVAKAIEAMDRAQGGLDVSPDLLASQLSDRNPLARKLAVHSLLPRVRPSPRPRDPGFSRRKGRAVHS